MRLRAAYAATDYQLLDGENWFGVRLGCRSAAIDRLLERLGAASGTFITGWNPRSRPTNPAENEAAAAALTADLQARRLHALPHRGVGDDPAWPAEEGWFVLDLDEAAGRALAEAHEQNAIVRVERGGPACLIETKWLLYDG